MNIAYVSMNVLRGKTPAVPCGSVFFTSVSVCSSAYVRIHANPLVQAQLRAKRLAAAQRDRQIAVTRPPTDVDSPARVERREKLNEILLKATSESASL